MADSGIMKKGAVVRWADIYVGYLLLFFWLVTEGDGRIHLVKLYPFVRVGAILALLEKASARHGGLPLFAIVSSELSLNQALVLPLQGVVVPHAFFEQAMGMVPMGTAVWVGPLRQRERIEQVALAGGHGILTDLPKRVVKYLRPPVELHIRRPHERP